MDGPNKKSINTILHFDFPEAWNSVIEYLTD